MRRSPFQVILLTLVLLSIAVVPAKVDGATKPVGVRIHAADGIKLNGANFTPDRVIDYGSFIWAILSPTALQELDETGIAYQTRTNPFELTLGGKKFDPLDALPIFGTNWQKPSTNDGVGLHLVQFYGPTKDEWLQSLQAGGLDVIQYIHPFTYLVWGDPTAVPINTRNEIIRWTGDFQPAYAVQPEYRMLNSDPILVRVMVVPQAGLTETIQAVEALGGSLVASASGVDPSFDLLTFMLPGSLIQASAALPGIFSIQPVPTNGGDRGEMSNQINAGNYSGNNQAFPGYLNWLSSLNLSGDGVVIANVDSGIDDTHPDLIGRMRPCVGITCGGSLMSDHGTHTAGIMAGDASLRVTDSFGFLRGLGMAPGAELVEQVYYLVGSNPDQMAILMRESYQNQAQISGNSWGPSSSPLGYDLDTRLVDVGVRDAVDSEPSNQPLSYVLSIMNGWGGVSTQGTPDEAKNIFTIGSTYMQNENTGFQSLNINDLSINSAHGPALDGRNIPHLVAPGWAVDSTLPYARYGLKGGTSMASPHVTGAAALFIEQYRKAFSVDPSPALIKAAFLPVAHDLAGNLDADNNILGHPFDSKQGWGRLNAAAVLNPEVDVLYFDQETIFDNTGQTWSITLKSREDFEYLHAMLVWTDAPGHGIGGDTPAWVNDLDLSLIINGQTYYGNNFGTDGDSIPYGTPDFMNNTEGVFLPRSLKGDCIIKVTAANISGDGIPNFGDTTDQDFALAIYYAISEPSPVYYFPVWKN